MSVVKMTMRRLPVRIRQAGRLLLALPLLFLMALPLAAQAPAAEFDVKTYGAVGDGAHDDHDAIQAALDAAAANGGGKVIVSTGTYLSSRIFRVGANVSIQGQRGSLVRMLAPQHPDERGAFFVQGNNVQISGLHLDLNYQTTLNGIAVVNVTNFRITGVTIERGMDYGIWIFQDPTQGSAPSGEGMISGCDVAARDCYEIFGGIRVAVSDCIARGDATRLQRPTTNGFLVWGGGHSVSVQGCRALGSYLSGAFTAMGLESTHPQPRNVDTHVTFTGCNADISQGSGFFFYDASFVSGSGNHVAVSGAGIGINIGQSDTTAGASHDIRLGASVHTGSGECVRVYAVRDVELTLDLETDSAPYLARIGSSARNVTFLGGRFKLGSSLGTSGHKGVQVYPCQGLVFQGTRFTGSSQGYDLFNNQGTCNYLSFDNCTFDGVRINAFPKGQFRQVRGCRFMDTKGVLLANNTFYINLYGADSYQISDNVVGLTSKVTNFLLNDAGTLKSVQTNLVAVAVP